MLEFVFHHDEIYQIILMIAIQKIIIIYILAVSLLFFTFMA